ncbi:hypothetical protein ABPG72_012277 [Tetrahymena utriculariae]
MYKRHKTKQNQTEHLVQKLCEAAFGDISSLADINQDEIRSLMQQSYASSVGAYLAEIKKKGLSSEAQFKAKIKKFFKFLIESVIDALAEYLFYSKQIGQAENLGQQSILDQGFEKYNFVSRLSTENIRILVQILDQLGNSDALFLQFINLKFLKLIKFAIKPVKQESQQIEQFKLTELSAVCSKLFSSEELITFVLIQNEFILINIANIIKDSLQKFDQNLEIIQVNLLVLKSLFNKSENIKQISRIDELVDIFLDCQEILFENIQIQNENNQDSLQSLIKNSDKIIQNIKIQKDFYQLFYKLSYCSCFDLTQNQKNNLINIMCTKYRQLIQKFYDQSQEYSQNTREDKNYIGFSISNLLVFIILISQGPQLSISALINTLENYFQYQILQELDQFTVYEQVQILKRQVVIKNMIYDQTPLLNIDHKLNQIVSRNNKEIQEKKYIVLRQIIREILQQNKDQAVTNEQLVIQIKKYINDEKLIEDELKQFKFKEGLLIKISELDLDYSHDNLNTGRSLNNSDLSDIIKKPSVLKKPSFFNLFKYQQDLIINSFTKQYLIELFIEKLGVCSINDDLCKDMILTFEFYIYIWAELIEILQNQQSLLTQEQKVALTILQESLLSGDKQSLLSLQLKKLIDTFSIKKEKTPLGVHNLQQIFLNDEKSFSIQKMTTS